MIEEWLPIKGYEGLYEVSNLGRIKSLERKKWNGKSNHIWKEKILKFGTNGANYLAVNLYKNKKRKFITIHKLVATTFIDNPNNYLEINHTDENPKNNAVINLEWCNRKYNCNYGTRNQKVIHCKKVYQYDLQNNLIKTWSSSKEASDTLNINVDSIYHNVAGKLKTAGGFVWKYNLGGE